MVICPYCGETAEFVSSAEVYGGRDYGYIYLCRPCDAYVGCHGNSTEPLGTLANAELRGWRNRAHAAFDAAWKTGGMQRTDAYIWLADQLEMPDETCHIGMFDTATCKRVIKICIEKRIGVPV